MTSTRFAILITSLSATVVCLAGCGGSKPQSSVPEVAPGAETRSGEEPGAPDVPWEQKTRQQRMEYMGLVVFPKMKETFQAYSAEEFADFKCQTCHGEDMEAVDFEMPNALYALSASDPVADATDYDEKMAQFMLRTVVPTMAELLEEEVYSPETQKGLSCFECHQKEK